MAAVCDIARSENIRAEVLTPFTTGTNLVVDLDGRLVLKLFPPLYRAQFVSERASLRVLDGRLSLPIPRIVAENERDGWSYLILTRQNGVLASDVWSALDETEKKRVLAGVGRAIAEVQSVSPGELLAIEPGWSDFLDKQAARCIERHRRQGLSQRFLDGIAELLPDIPSIVPRDAPPVILTGEWIPENLLLTKESGEWKLSALIDFGDVMTGWREYDLLGPSTFMCAGSAARVASLMEGYGLQMNAVDAAMRRRLLALLILHRASDFRNIDIEHWGRRADQLIDLEAIIWPMQ